MERGWESYRRGREGVNRVFGKFRAPLATWDDSRCGEAGLLQGSGDFQSLFPQHAGENQPAILFGGAGDARGGREEDVAEEIGHHQIDRLLDIQLQDIALHEGAAFAAVGSGICLAMRTAAGS